MLSVSQWSSIILSDEGDSYSWNVYYNSLSRKPLYFSGKQTQSDVHLNSHSRMQAFDIPERYGFLGGVVTSESSDSR